MALWIVFAVLTAVTILAVAAPLMKGGSPGGEGASGRPSASDEEVYRSQLEELEAERAQGLVGDAEYAAARIEISRRLLHAVQGKAVQGKAPAAKDDKAAPAKAAPAGPRGSWAAKGWAYATVVAVPLGALSLYLHYGSPDLPGRPLKERLAGPVEKQSVDALLFQVEQRLRQHPEDGVGWSVVAPVYLKMGRYDDAADAYDRAIRLQGETVSRLVGMGEALVFANQGEVTAEAQTAFTRARQLDPQAHIASFWLSISYEKLNQWDKAAATYREMLGKDLPAEMRTAVAARLKHAEERATQITAGGAAPSPAPAPAPASQNASADRGPTAADVQAAQSMSEGDRAAMINQMTERLAARLDKDGADLTGWLKLMRAYSVLGRKDDALKALASARKNFTGNTEALGQIDELARSLGLTS